MIIALGMIGYYLTSPVGTGVEGSFQRKNHFLFCICCLVPVSSNPRIQPWESHTRNEAREIVREALGPGM
jgi:hypothetical protein